MAEAGVAQVNLSFRITNFRSGFPWFSPTISSLLPQMNPCSGLKHCHCPQILVQSHLPTVAYTFLSHLKCPPLSLTILTPGSSCSQFPQRCSTALSVHIGLFSVFHPSHTSRVERSLAFLWSFMIFSLSYFTCLILFDGY